MTIEDHTEAWERLKRSRISPDFRPEPTIFERYLSAWKRWCRHREVRALNRRADRMLRSARRI